MSDYPYKALIIDDEPDLLSLLAISLRKMDIESIKAKNVKSALKKLEQDKFDLCLTDLRLPDGNGMEIVQHIQTHYPNTPIAVITAFGDPKTAVQALKSGAFDYVSKPIEVDELETMVKTALRLQSESDPDSSSLTLLGNSEPIKKIRELIHKVSRNLAPVHIHGETGTGKELIARLIHDSSPRATAPFVAVNCGAIPRELMESEFFGHIKGSFTGAYQDKIGLFEAANSGTLFLDEIAELPQQLQVKLLRVIQDKKVRPVGSTVEKSTDVRLISATHKNLMEMIKNETFREDFYYRINVIPIEAPALRDRKEDIPLLVTHFMNQISTKSGVSTPTLAKNVLQSLEHYLYPGNVRELENILERAIALCEGEIITSDDISISSAQNSQEEVSLTNMEVSIEQHLEKIEAKLIQEALNKTRGNITEAAKVLGTSFRSLRYKIKKLNISE